MRTETNVSEVYWFISWKNSLNEDMGKREYEFAYSPKEADEIVERVRQDSHNYDIRNDVKFDRRREWVEQ